ncbi:hypothetical protein ABT010_32910 [Streptomyces sp. NPDC002668]
MPKSAGDRRSRSGGDGAFAGIDQDDVSALDVYGGAQPTGVG